MQKQLILFKTFTLHIKLHSDLHSSIFGHPQF